MSHSTEMQPFCYCPDQKMISLPVTQLRWQYFYMRRSVIAAHHKARNKRRKGKKRNQAIKLQPVITLNNNYLVLSCRAVLPVMMMIIIITCIWLIDNHSLSGRNLPLTKAHFPFVPKQPPRPYVFRQLPLAYSSHWYLHTIHPHKKAHGITMVSLPYMLPHVFSCMKLRWQGTDRH